MSEKGTCASCSLSSWWVEPSPEDNDPGWVFCQFPAARLPLSFQGVAQRERETMPADATGCPTHEERT